MPRRRVWCWLMLTIDFQACHCSAIVSIAIAHRSRKILISSIDRSRKQIAPKFLRSLTDRPGFYNIKTKFYISVFYNSMIYEVRYKLTGCDKILSVFLFIGFVKIQQYRILDWKSVLLRLTMLKILRNYWSVWRNEILSWDRLIESSLDNKAMRLKRLIWRFMPSYVTLWLLTIFKCWCMGV